MIFVSRVLVGDRVRVVVSRKGRFSTILSAGAHTLFGFGIEIARHRVDEAYLISPWRNRRASAEADHHE